MTEKEFQELKEKQLREGEFGASCMGLIFALFTIGMVVYLLTL